MGSYRELQINNQLESQVPSSCGEPPCSVTLTSSKHCKTDCFKGQANYINNLIAKKIKHNVNNKADDA